MPTKSSTVASLGRALISVTIGFLKSHGFTIREITIHDFQRLLRRSPETAAFSTASSSGKRRPEPQAGVAEPRNVPRERKARERRAQETRAPERETPEKKRQQRGRDGCSEHRACSQGAVQWVSVTPFIESMDGWFPCCRPACTYIALRAWNLRRHPEAQSREDAKDPSNKKRRAVFI